MNLARIIREEYGQLNEYVSSSKNDLIEFLNSFDYTEDDYGLVDMMDLKLYIKSKHIKHINVLINRLEKNHHWFLSGASSDFDDYENNVGEIKKYIKYNLEQMSQEYAEEVDDELLTLYFEPRFSNTINKENIPDYVYHITDRNNLQNIKRIGLVLKNKNKLSYHPKRIYLFIKRNGIESILDNMSFDINNPILLKINVRNYKEENEFYIDPKLDDGGVYVLNNIPANLIVGYEEIERYDEFE